MASVPPARVLEHAEVVAGRIVETLGGHGECYRASARGSGSASSVVTVGGSATVLDALKGEDLAKVMFEDREQRSRLSQSHRLTK